MSTDQPMEPSVHDDTIASRVVAIDGVLGSGKTTVARRVAEVLGVEYLDTGAMYRSVALASTQIGVDLDAAAAGTGSDRDAVVSIARRAVIEVLRNHDGSQTVRLDGADVTAAIRTPEASRGASVVATIPAVRAELVERQRAWTRARGGGVLEGRDIAAVVFPNAGTKVFLTASVEERARRRHAEQPDRALTEVVADLQWRDDNDSTRAADPLKVADGAIVVDTTGLEIDEVVGRVASLAQASMQSGPPPVSDAASPVQKPAARRVDSVEKAARARAVLRRIPLLGGGLDRRFSKGLGDRFANQPKTAPPAAADRSIAEHLASTDTRRKMLVFRVCRLIVVPLIKWYFRIDYQGLHNVPTTGAFIVAPTHRSNVDFILLPRISKRRMRFMGKDSIWKVKALANFFDGLGGIPVKRGTTDRESMRICSAVLEHGEPLVIFPEGLRKSGPLIEDLFDGVAYLAAKHRVPILPIGIGNTESSMPKGSKFPRPVRVRLVVGRPIPAPATGRSSVRAATAELQERLQGLFDEASS